METKNLIARAQVTIHAPVNKVWDALVTPETIKKYMFGTTVISDWKEGSKITWKGEWQGKPYEDKGVILQIKPKIKFQYTHFSPLSGLKDAPENYHTITIELSGRNQVIVSLSQDKNSSEKERTHSEQNWASMLSGLKKLLEQSN